ncbi:crotonase/enoyl-CoA hydratase family protein [Corticibacter populi]|uniref:Crotonase/enoyl-CoA hydratase family protein n=2 Tax=Corticibacter populi TaxID=1550736 RepID=A0A3M6QVB5_9BURK|nr:crotonase/enoyl-CoA hydratase family protein [Corticibacter populi]
MQQRFHDRVAVRQDDDGIAQVWLQRPDKMNALDDAMLAGLVAAGDWLRSAKGLRAVVLAGEGQAFCAGLDMANFSRIAEGKGMDVAAAAVRERTHGVANLFQQVGWQWRALAVPVIAAVQGVAFGGGLQLALGADMRYLAADARLSVREIHWGLVPDMAGMPLLRELVRADLARELVFTGRIVAAEEACAIGLGTRLVPDPLTAAMEQACAIAGCNPDAIRAGKRLLNMSADAGTAELLQAESLEQLLLLGSDHQREAVAAALSRRKPVFVED